jgi:hypothetical protein
MAHRSSAEVRSEIESERKRLGEAVKTLRGARRRLPLVAASALGTSLALRTAVRLVSRRRSPGKDERGRFSFLRR